MPLPQRLVDACRARGMSLAKACRRAGLKYSTLHAQIANQRAIPFTSVEKLARVLDLPLSYFASDAHQLDTSPLGNAADTFAMLAADGEAGLDELGRRLTTDFILDWLAGNDSRMTGTESFIDHVNLYYPSGPEDEIPRPFRIGPKSLTARYLKLLSIDRYSDVIALFDVTSQAEIIRSHREVQGRDYLVTDHKIDAVMDSGRVRGTYRRILAPVVMQTGQRMILQFSKLTHFSGA